MIWSPLRHSLNLNGPSVTAGFVFSGALSKSSAFAEAVTYLPKTCVGSGLADAPPRSRIAGHETFVSVTVNFFGFDESIAMPEIVSAVALHCALAGRQNSLNPLTSWYVDLRTVFADRPT